MNLFVRQMIFTSLNTKIMGDIKKKGLTDQLGKLKSISFILTREKTVQRVVFEKYTGENALTVEDRDKFAAMVSIDVKKELASCHTILASLFFETKKIVVNKVFTDRENEITTY